MNKRIRELAAQAMVERASGFREFDADLFAELIVEECIDIVENYPSWYGDYRDQIEDAFRGHLIAKMKYHFGVES
jgi:hypothetical protein